MILYFVCCIIISIIDIYFCMVSRTLQRVQNRLACTVTKAPPFSRSVCLLPSLHSFNQSFNQSNFYIANIPGEARTHWRDSQIGVQQQNRGNSPVTSTGHGEWRYLCGKGQVQETFFTLSVRWIYFNTAQIPSRVIFVELSHHWRSS